MGKFSADGLKAFRAKDVCGGNWNDGAYAGSRSANLNNYPWNVNPNIGSRFARDFNYIQRHSFTELCPSVYGVRSLVLPSKGKDKLASAVSKLTEN